MKALLLMCTMAVAASAADPIRVMLLDGESGGTYHKWQLVTPVLKKMLDETGLFQVDVVTAPPAGGDFSAFKPDFAKYKVVVWNYDAPDERWSFGSWTVATPAGSRKVNGPQMRRPQPSSAPSKR